MRALGARDFVTDDQAADRGRNDDVAGGQPRGELPAEAFGMSGMLQHQRALQVFIRMETAGEAKMALQIRAGFAKDLQDGFGHEINYSNRTAIFGRSAAGDRADISQAVRK
jgi:hypothetical protein